MRSKTRPLAASVILVVSLSVSQVELTALARNPDDGVRTAPENAPARGALKVPTLVPPPKAPQSATTVWTKQAAVPQDQPPKKKSGALKWILIGAGAGTAAAIIATRSSQNPTPVITVGAPVVVQPQ
jgi:hypothetical protein